MMSTSTSSEEESGRVQQAASILMQALQDQLVNSVPRRGDRSEVTSAGNRQRRKRRRIQLTGEPGPPSSGPSSSGESRRDLRRLTTAGRGSNDTQQPCGSAHRDILHDPSLSVPPPTSSLARSLEYKGQAGQRSRQLLRTRPQPVTDQDKQGQRRSRRDSVPVQPAPPRPPVVQSSVGAVSRTIDEHKKLFRFQPSKQYSQRKGKGPARTKNSTMTAYWKKNSFCLADCQQMVKPTPQEKIALAKIGLEIKCLVFNSEGNAHHVHSVIMNEWPVLESCGGYTLLRLAENSHGLIEIESPLTGHISVKFLKAILNNATLYVRPLQRDICCEDMQQFYSVEVSIVEM